MATENLLFEVVIGTYEKYLLGYNLEMNSDEFHLKPSFSTEAHLQSIKCLASTNKYLVSGSTDEAIQLFDMKSRQEVGALLHHNGTVTDLGFYDSYLFSCSEDSTICVWSLSNWQCVKTLYGHKSSIKSIAIHPSGKLALSVSKDKTLRTWNLIKGRSAYVTNIKKYAEKVRWSPDGNYYLVLFDKEMDIYSVESASVISTIEFQYKICDYAFIKDDVIAVCGEHTSILFYEIPSGRMSFEFEAHKCRIKAINCISVSDETFLVTASSDGILKVWHLDSSEIEKKPRRIAKVKTGCRPTCMTVMLRS